MTGKRREQTGVLPPPSPHFASAADVLAPVSAQLEEVEARLAAVCDVDNVVLQQVLRLSLGGGGKRLRPALVLLAAGFDASPTPRRLQLAAAAELLHTATLVHDDVLDEAAARRGRITANAALGNTLAVLTGDYLFAKAAELVAGLDSPAIMGVFAWAVMELCQGEMMPVVLDGDFRTVEERYLVKIRSKTASLLAMSCQTGAMLGCSGAARASVLRDFGLSLGMAFQITDDILDLTSTEARLGKPVGSDLRQGTPTLPSIYFLQEPESAGHPLVRRLLEHAVESVERADEAIEWIRRSPAIPRARQRAQEYAATARSSLAALPDHPCRAALDRITSFVIQRED